jgi:hypothetical protein
MSDIKDDIQEVKKQTTFEKYFTNILTSLVLAGVLFVYNRLDRVNETMIRLDENVKSTNSNQVEMKNDLNQLKLNLYDLRREVDIMKAKQRQ